MLCPCADQESIKNDQFRGHTQRNWVIDTSLLALLGDPNVQG